MDQNLRAKNDFVENLRDHLAELYETEYYDNTDNELLVDIKKFTNFVIYSAIKRNPMETPYDLSGFCFRKNLCNFAPGSSKAVYEEIHNFALSQGIESTLEETGRKITLSTIPPKQKEEIIHLTLKIEEKEYNIHAYVDPLYAGYIDVYLSESLFQKFSLLNEK